jgi:hypothetical protein
VREKSAGEIRLIDACRQPGCPVCRRVREESLGHLQALVDEHVTDPDTRRALRASWGLCNWHTWMLLDVDTGRLGASIYHEDLLREAIDRVAEVTDRRRPRLGAWLARVRGASEESALVAASARRTRCPLCVTAAGAERECLLSFLRLIDDPELAGAYAEASAICLRHLVAAVALRPDADQTRRLVERTRPKWQAIRGALRSFVDKHDYRNRAAYTDEEIASCVRAFEVLAGAPGVFGNDLAVDSRHPRRRGH